MFNLSDRPLTAEETYTMAMEYPDGSFTNSSMLSQRLPDSVTLDTFVRLAREHLHMRRSRERIFPPDLFADPAWDILLDLFICEQVSRKVSVSSACLAACVPPTTALRWIAKLEEMGLIERRADGSDGRRQLLNLSADARNYLFEWFSGVLQHGLGDIARPAPYFPDASLHDREPLDIARELVSALRRSTKSFN